MPKKGTKVRKGGCRRVPRLRLLLTLSAALFFCVGIVRSLRPSRLRIYISATTPDTAGQTLLYYLREQIARSSRYELATAESDALFQVRLVTLNPYGQQAQSASTVHATVLTGTQLVSPYATLYLQQWVGSCPTATMQSCATTLFASIDGEVTGLYEALLNSAKNNNGKK